MSTVHGFKCDKPGCSEFSVGTSLPDRWMTLTVQTILPGRGPTEVGKGPEFHLCSNKCLKSFATDRHKAAIESGAEEGSYYQMKRMRDAAT